MSELVVVANRGPATLYQDDHGVTRAKHAAGGLAPSLGRALSKTQATWVAAATSDIERAAAAHGVPDIERNFDLHLVDINPKVASGALRVIANGTLWFLHHDLFDRAYRPLFTSVVHEAWEQFRAYNRAMAAGVAECADEGATVVVNDYHLSLLGTALATERPDLRTVYFSHTPFCSPEELTVLPRAIGQELIEGLCAFGACGFHTERWVTQFRACASSIGVQTPDVFASPLGIDAESLLTLAGVTGL